MRTRTIRLRAATRTASETSPLNPCAPTTAASTWTRLKPQASGDSAGGRLNAGGGLFKLVAMRPNKVEDAAPEFKSRVQMVSCPPGPDPQSVLTGQIPAAAAILLLLTAFWKTP
jgi:hypothetical protein